MAFCWPLLTPTHYLACHTVGGYLSEHIGTGGYSDNWSMTEGVHIMLAHVKKLYAEWVAALALSCWRAAVTTCDTFPDSTGLLPDTVYVIITRMRTTVSHCSVSISCGKLAIPNGCFHLCCEAYLARRSYPVSSAAIQLVERALKHDESSRKYWVWLC